MKLVESQELAAWDQNNDPYGKGWAEDYSGYITIESDSIITVKDEIETKESFYLNLINEEYTSYNKDQIDDFVSKFFPKGVPVFTVKKSEKESWTSTYEEVQIYNYFDIFCEGNLIDTQSYKDGKTTAQIEKELNMVMVGKI